VSADKPQTIGHLFESKIFSKDTRSSSPTYSLSVCFERLEEESDESELDIPVRGSGKSKITSTESKDAQPGQGKIRTEKQIKAEPRIKVEPRIKSEPQTKAEPKGTKNKGRVQSKRPPLGLETQAEASSSALTAEGTMPETRKRSFSMANDTEGDSATEQVQETRSNFGDSSSLSEDGVVFDEQKPTSSTYGLRDRKGLRQTRKM
jgi:hypothetical protein